MITRRNKIIFSLLPVLVIVLLVAATEVLLRVFAAPGEGKLVTESTYDGIRWYMINRSYLEKYFPANTPLVPEFKPSLFRKEKPKNLFRIMCLGESSMFGTPYEMTATIPGMLRKMLRSSCPNQEFEVINWGASAINSNVILDLSREISAFEPDAVIIYMGHNEFYGPDGVGASWIEKKIPALTGLKYRLRNLKVSHLIQSLLTKSSPLIRPGEESNLMRQVSKGSHVRLESDDAARIFRNFEQNLGEIIKIFKGLNIPVIVSDVTSNLDFPPFESDTVPTPYAESFKSMQSGLDSGRYPLKTFEQILTCDTSNALLNYLYGRALEKARRPREAKAFLMKARDNDLLKFRAPGAINRIIERVCNETGTEFFSSDSLFSSLSLDWIPGDSLFWEHLHPRAYGYYQIASTFFQKFAEKGLIPLLKKTDILPFNEDSLSICWVDLAYADLIVKHLTGKWPFSNYKFRPAVIEKAGEAVRQVLNEVYFRKIGWDEGCHKAALLFWKEGRYEEARKIYEAMIEDYPYNFYTQYLLGSLLNNMKRGREAIEHYRISIRSNPSYPNSRLDIGLIEVNQGNFKDAIRQLDTVLTISDEKAPADLKATAYYGLAAAYANMAEYPKALGYIDKSLLLEPGNANAVLLKKSILEGEGLKR